MIAARCLQPSVGQASARVTALRTLVPEIATARLRLRAPVAADFPTWAEIFAAEDSDYTGGRRILDDAWLEFANYAAGWMLHGHGLWTVTLAETLEVLGFVLVGLEWDDPEPELAYFFPARARGQGYALEAAEAVLAHAADLFGPVSLVSYVHDGNARSAQLAMKLGATRDAAAEDRIAHRFQVWRHGPLADRPSAHVNGRTAPLFNEGAA